MTCPHCGNPATDYGICNRWRCERDEFLELLEGDPSLTDGERNEGADL